MSVQKAPSYITGHFSEKKKQIPQLRRLLDFTTKRRETPAESPEEPEQILQHAQETHQQTSV